MVDWPATLPQSLLVTGYQEGVAEGRLTSKTDTGPGKMRARSSSSSRPMQGSVEMTDAQVTILLAFIEDDLEKGTLPFYFPAQRGSGTWLARFASDGLPQWSRFGAEYWSVSFTLELLP